METSTRVETIQEWKMDKETRRKLHFLKVSKYSVSVYWAIFHLISPTVIVVQVINEGLDTHEKQS